MSGYAHVRDGSKGEILAASRCFPLCPQNRTSLNAVGMSETCQQETHAPQQINISIRSPRRRVAAAMMPAAMQINFFMRKLRTGTFRWHVYCNRHAKLNAIYNILFF